MKTAFAGTSATWTSNTCIDVSHEHGQEDRIIRMCPLGGTCDAASDDTLFKMTHKPQNEQAKPAFHRSAASKHEDSCRCCFNPPGTNYYVSTIDGSRFALLAGPFETHTEACEWVNRARDEACRVDPRAWFYAFGTTAMRPEYRKPGVLNDLLDLDRGR